MTATEQNDNLLFLYKLYVFGGGAKVGGQGEMNLKTEDPQVYFHFLHAS